MSTTARTHILFCSLSPPHTQFATMLAQSAWPASVNRLLSHSPETREDRQLWLALLPLLNRLASTHALQPTCLHFLATALAASAVPILALPEPPPQHPGLLPVAAGDVERRQGVLEPQLVQVGGLGH